MAAADYEKLGAFYLGQEYDLTAGTRRPEAARAGRAAAEALVRAYDRDGGWALHSFRERVILPSLFSGSSGIGLALLAAAGAEEAASVLLLS